MVGLAFEIHDTNELKEKLKLNPGDDGVSGKLKFTKIKPTFLDIVAYSYCFIAMFTGNSTQSQYETRLL